MYCSVFGWRDRRAPSRDFRLFHFSLPSKLRTTADDLGQSESCFGSRGCGLHVLQVLVLNITRFHTCVTSPCSGTIALASPMAQGLHHQRWPNKSKWLPQIARRPEVLPVMNSDCTGRNIAVHGPSSCSARKNLAVHEKILQCTIRPEFCSARTKLLQCRDLVLQPKEEKLNLLKTQCFSNSDPSKPGFKPDFCIARTRFVHCKFSSAGEG